ncbi:hypothetical protein COU37_05165 [Candidatus Micrarchaeota archaeon CG10_big_fil_rev_8_21_14_0_10_45_29]|nr:MAG: hypothetical protein COU37_05165 [Candidatus Micrarchaeota archaeon CG10_big_fil_rev_8_21_14_0_10_45_29]
MRKQIFFWAVFLAMLFLMGCNSNTAEEKKIIQTSYGALELSGDFITKLREMNESMKAQYSQLDAKMCVTLESNDPLIRNTAVSIVSSIESNSWSAERLLALYSFMKKNIAYVEDPIGAEYIATATETLTVGGGDCEDQASLIASMIRSVGGRAIIAYSLSCGHAVAFAYIGTAEQMDTVGDELASLYGQTYLPYTYIQDDAGYWLVIDPAGGQYLGDTFDSCTEFRTLSC